MSDDRCTEEIVIDAIKNEIRDAIIFELILLSFRNLRFTVLYENIRTILYKFSQCDLSKCIVNKARPAGLSWAVNSALGRNTSTCSRYGECNYSFLGKKATETGTVTEKVPFRLLEIIKLVWEFFVFEVFTFDNLPHRW